MLSRIALVLLLVSLCPQFQCAEEQSWISAGYWSRGIPVSEINSALFTHLICGFASVNSSSNELFISSSDEADFSNFTSKVKEKNPSIKTLVSVDGSTLYSSMVSNASSRRSFIQSSINLARRYGFQGLDLYWYHPETDSNMNDLASLFEERRTAANSELILTATVNYSPALHTTSSFVELVMRNLNWIHVTAFNYAFPGISNVTAAHSALYDPSSRVNTDYGISQWIGRGVPSNKLVLGLPFYGFAWNLTDPKDIAIGAPATRPAKTRLPYGLMIYKEIKADIPVYGAKVPYNATYLVNYCSLESTWIGFDDVEVIKIKVSYAKKKKLLGYFVYQVSFDDDWMLSLTAKGADDKLHRTLPLHRTSPMREIILIINAVSILLFGVIIYIPRRGMFKLKATRDSSSNVNKEAAGYFHGNAPDLKVFSFSDIERATYRFSTENMIGEGGYGPVYKEIAVKKRSKSSTQGFEEFKNEVTVAARLQHVNLIRLLGFCIDREEQMLVYEYMPNKSLAFYLFDPKKQHLLDWKQRVCIIEGVTQGLLYLQEYSRLTIIHKDLKASNILLDHEMKPKISDFGMARPFKKDEHEANTSRLVGTYGYIPPEYVKKGLLSIKSDVYNFGVLLLQIISGKRISGLYGENNDFNLLEHAYMLWKEGKGIKFVDSSLDDTSSSYKLLRCLQTALLCVQENAEDRPCMLEVSSMLRNESNCIATPKQPAYSKVENEEVIKFIQQPEICSQNETTLSPILGR